MKHKHDKRLTAGMIVTAGALKNVDSSETLDSLRTLYSLTYTPLGKAAVVATMRQNSNLKVLLPFLDTAGTRM